MATPPAPALCDWVDGRLRPALDSLADLAEKSQQPVVKFYALRLADELGDRKIHDAYIYDLDLKDFTLKARGLR